MHKFLSIFCLSALLTVNTAIAHEDHGKAMHGGTVAEGGLAQFEVVGKDGKVTVYVSQHGVPLATAGASGKLTVLSGTSKRDIELKPSAHDQMQGQGMVMAGDKLLLTMSLSGQKPIQARATVSNGGHQHGGH